MLLRLGALAVIGAARSDVALHLAGHQRLVRDLQDQVRPDDVETEEEQQETVEDEIRREHWQ